MKIFVKQVLKNPEKSMFYPQLLEILKLFYISIYYYCLVM